MTIGGLACTYDPSRRRTTTSGTYAHLNLPGAQAHYIYSANNQLTKFDITTLRGAAGHFKSYGPWLHVSTYARPVGFTVFP